MGIAPSSVQTKMIQISTTRVCVVKAARTKICQKLSVFPICFPTIGGSFFSQSDLLVCSYIKISSSSDLMKAQPCLL